MAVLAGMRQSFASILECQIVLTGRRCHLVSLAPYFLTPIPNLMPHRRAE
jgi:hypothetical protein